MDKINKNIAVTLRKMRKLKGWSLDKTSKATGVSKAMLGQIERGESSPTISTLWKIATGFETSFSAFLEDFNINTADSTISRGEMRTLHPNDEKMQVLTLFPLVPKLNFELFVIKLHPGCEHHSESHQVGVIEHIVVAEGSVEILSEGKWHSISKGEGIKLNADMPHGYRNLSSEEAIIHDIIHYPNVNNDSHKMDGE